MKNFDSGVKRYIFGTCSVSVGFPVDFRDNADVRCEQCKFYSRSNRYCKLNGELCEYPEKYIGSKCPLNFEEE